MVNTLADNVDTIVDNQPTVQSETSQKIGEHTPGPQPPVAAPRTQSLEPRPRPHTPVTHPLSGLEFLGFVSPLRIYPMVPTQQEAEAAGNTSDVDVDQQLLRESAVGDSVPVVPLPDVAILDVHLSETRPDSSVGEDLTSPRIAEQACIQVRVAFLVCEFPLL